MVSKVNHSKKTVRVGDVMAVSCSKASSELTKRLLGPEMNPCLANGKYSQQENQAVTANAADPLAFAVVGRSLRSYMMAGILHCSWWNVLVADR